MTTKSTAQHGTYISSPRQRHFLSCLACFLLASSAISVEVKEASPALIQGGPDIIWGHSHDYPLWVSAKAANDGNGSFEARLFSTPLFISDDYDPACIVESLTGSKKTLATEGLDCECTYFTVWSHGAGKPADTQTQATQNSWMAFFGRIDRITMGFFLNSPASILTVVPDHVFVGEAETRDQVYFHVVVPHASFVIGDKLLCSPVTSLPAAVGDRIAVFPLWQAMDEAGTLLMGMPDEIVYFGADGPTWPEEWRRHGTEHSSCMRYRSNEEAEACLLMSTAEVKSKAVAQ